MRLPTIIEFYESPFNRTSMESKPEKNGQAYITLEAFNRTSMESKQPICLPHLNQTRHLLIEPVWNRN